MRDLYDGRFSIRPDYDLIIILYLLTKYAKYNLNEF
jgi:hypothetical protein